MKVSFVNKVKFHIKKLYRKAKLPGDDSSQKMPSCTCLKASYTLEAAVIFPLVAGFFVFILFFFRVVQVESQVKAALYYSSRMSALASSANDSSVVSVATAEVLFRSRISDSKHIDTYVSGGRYGVSLLGSSMGVDHHRTVGTDHHAANPPGADCDHARFRAGFDALHHDGLGSVRVAVLSAAVVVAVGGAW